jgi:hypothetical protein
MLLAASLFMGCMTDRLGLPIDFLLMPGKTLFTFGEPVLNGELDTLFRMGGFSLQFWWPLKGDGQTAVPS